MSSQQWTIPKLVTWRVKDWASCFLASKFPPLDADEDGVNKNNGNTTNNNSQTFKRVKRKMKSSKKKRSERKLSLSPPGTRHHHIHLRSSSVSPTSASQNRSQPPVSSDEPGFIVFCFDQQDGGFDVVKEGKQEKKEIQLSLEKSPNTVNRKLNYGDKKVEEIEKNNKDEKVEEIEKNDNSPETNGTEQDQNDKTPCKETEDVSSDVHEKNEEEEEEESDKSSGSNRSEERRGSFAFPILGLEWMGSPVQMPKSDDFSPKKQKPTSLGFQCCRF